MIKNKKPRISLVDINDDKIENVLNDIKESQSVLAFFRSKKGECKFLHTGLGKKDYATIIVMITRHLGLLNFLKLACKHADLYINCTDNQGINFNNKALEYLEWKKNNFNQIKTNIIL